MSRVAPLSGFPEWTPEGRVIERHIIDTLRNEFELHGFAEVETRAVEPLDRLAGDSEASKEIYALRRLRADAGEGDSGLGLHFDLTVPFARYVEEFSGHLAFPFRRYQIQKVWRGERPQSGRFREFYQADIDVVGRDDLPGHCDVEVASVALSALSRLRPTLGVPELSMRVNDRRLVEAYYRGLGITDVVGTLRAIDKLSKVGDRVVIAELEANGLTSEQAGRCLMLTDIEARNGAVEVQLKNIAEAIDCWTPELDAAVGTLTTLVERINASISGIEGIAAEVDLSIARGLDYYTGPVFEVVMGGPDESLGSICSGGRYDSLVAGGGYPGVGMSVGVSRLMSWVLERDKHIATRGVPSAVCVAVIDEVSRSHSEAIARRLRARGIPSEVSPTAAKFGKQIQYADRRGIPYVWFPSEAGGDGEVKDIRSGDQTPADADSWVPPAEDLRPRVERR